MRRCRCEMAGDLEVHDVKMPQPMSSEFVICTPVTNGRFGTSVHGGQALGAPILDVDHNSLCEKHLSTGVPTPTSEDRETQRLGYKNSTASTERMRNSMAGSLTKSLSALLT